MIIAVFEAEAELNKRDGGRINLRRLDGELCKGAVARLEQVVLVARQAANVGRRVAACVGDLQMDGMAIWCCANIVEAQRAAGVEVRAEAAQVGRGERRAAVKERRVPAEAEVERHVVSDMLHAMSFWNSACFVANLVGTWGELAAVICPVTVRCSLAVRALPWAMDPSTITSWRAFCTTNSSARLLFVPTQAAHEMAVVDALRRSGLKRSTRLLQLFSLMLLGFGALCLIPLPGTGWLHKLGGVVSIASGSAGIVGLAFTWYRALVFYTTFSWLGAALAIIGITQLVVNKQVNPFPWIMWIGTALIALPPSILSTTMHILRVWRPQPMVEDSNAPLVQAAAESEGGLPPAEPQLGPGEYAAHVDRPAWPPPNPNGTAGGAYQAVENEPQAVVSDTRAGPPSWPPRVD